MRSSGIVPRVRILAPFLFLAALILVSVLLDRPLPRADIVYANTSENFTLDPQRLSYQHDVRTSRSLFEGLVNVNGENGTAEPAVATSWQRSEDGRTWTFHLRADARWSSGAPVTSHDFIYAWRRAMLPDLAADYTGFFLSIDGAKEFFEWRTKALADFSKTDGGAEAAPPAPADCHHLRKVSDGEQRGEAPEDVGREGLGRGGDVEGRPRGLGRGRSKEGKRGGDSKGRRLRGLSLSFSSFSAIAVEVEAVVDVHLA